MTRRLLAAVCDNANECYNVAANGHKFNKLLSFFALRISIETIASSRITSLSTFHVPCDSDLQSRKYGEKKIASGNSIDHTPLIFYSFDCRFDVESN